MAQSDISTAGEKERGGPRGRGPRTAGVGLAAAAGVLLVLLATARHGPAVSPDSTIYLSAAENLASGKGLTQFDGEPLVRWAPAYPAVLALAERFGADPLAAAGWLDALLFGVFVLLSAAWLRRHLREGPLFTVALAAVVCSPALLRSAVYVWSEMLFLVPALLCLLDLERAARDGARRPFWRAAVWAAAATMVRYAGVSLAAAGVWVALARRDRPLGRRLRDAAGFAAVTLGPFAAWLLRNQVVSGSALGERAASSYSAPATVYLGLEVLSRWLVPPFGPAPLRVVLVVVALAAVAGLLWAARRARQDGKGEPRPWPLGPMAIWVLAYSALLVVWTSTSAVEQINERYLTPLYLPLVGFGAAALGALARRPRRAVPLAVVLFVFSLWWWYPTARTALHFALYLGNGATGYTSVDWDHSELARLLRARPEAQPLYSNGPDAASFLADVPARMSPRARYYNSPQRVEGDREALRAAIEAAPEKRAYLAWFTALDRPFLHTPGELERWFVVRSDSSCADGTLYVLSERGE